MDVSILKNVSLFQGLTAAQLEKVSRIAGTQQLAGGSHVFREGDPGQSMYIIGEGKIRISKQVPGMGEEALAILDKGAYFGEMALIEDGPRSADAIAHTSCTLWVIERDKLDQIMFTDKELAYILLWTFVRTMSERLRDMNDKMKALFAMTKF
jgi:CRP/FNR family transcriptional regulator, cyclic AMP receptor protein